MLRASADEGTVHAGEGSIVRHTSPLICPFALRQSEGAQINGNAGQARAVRPSILLGSSSPHRARSGGPLVAYGVSRSCFAAGVTADSSLNVCASRGQSTRLIYLSFYQTAPVHGDIKMVGRW